MNRSRNQQATLELYLLLEAHQNRLEESVLYYSIFERIAAIIFSLWRAVFLSDVDATSEAQRDDLKGFLGDLISHNSIQYTTDRRARDWTFDYYLTNARLRLTELVQGDLKAIANLVHRPAASKKQSWEFSEEAVEAAIAWLTNELTRNGSA